MASFLARFDAPEGPFTSDSLWSLSALPILLPMLGCLLLFASMSRGKHDMSASAEKTAVAEETPPSAPEVHLKKRSRRQRKRGRMATSRTDLASDVEVPAPAEDSDEHVNTDDNRIDGEAEPAISGDSEPDAPLPANEASGDVKLTQETCSTTCSSESLLTTADCAPCAGVISKSGCQCGDEYAWGCQSCAVYSSALLLLHRDLNILIERGPPGLELEGDANKRIIATRRMFR